MNASLLDVLHDPGEEELLTVVDGIDIDLDSVVEESVDEHRVLRVYLGGTGEIVGEHRVVIHDLHSATAEDVARPDEYRIPDMLRDGLRLGK